MIYLQIIKLLCFLIVVVLVISVTLNKSPLAFFTGLGALTALIAVVFKDAILGFIASVQLTAYDIIRIGDWIEMPKYGADGDVLEITLSTIKVQNFDKTVSTIPTYAILADSFKNWSDMRKAGGRRIKRAIYIDMNTIKVCTAEMLKRFEVPTVGRPDRLLDPMISRNKHGVHSAHQ